MIPWSPRVILTNRLFRLPVQGPASAPPTLHAPGFDLVDSRWSSRDRAWMFYLRSPGRSGDFDIEVRSAEHSDSVTVQVRSLADLRSPSHYNGVDWPRRWPLCERLTTSKQRQTLQQSTTPDAVDEETLRWWTSQPDQALWDQLPASEFPRAHYMSMSTRDVRSAARQSSPSAVSTPGSGRTGRGCAPIVPPATVSSPATTCCQGISVAVTTLTTVLATSMGRDTYSSSPPPAIEIS